MMNGTRPWALPLVVILIVIVLAAAAVALVPSLRGMASAWWSYMNAPQAMKDAWFLTGDATDPSLAKMRPTSLATMHFDGYVIRAVATNGPRAFAVLEDPVRGKDVYEVTSGTPEPVTVNGGEKAYLAVSADGDTLAWSEYESLPEDGSFDLARYTLVTKDASGIVERSNGAHPRFLGSERLFYVSANGYTMLDLAKGESMAVSDESVQNVRSVSYLSDDGVLAMRNPLLPAFDLFKVEGMPPTLSYLGSVPHEAVADLAYVADAGKTAYGFRVEEGTAVLWRYDVASGEEVRVGALPYQIALITAALP